MQLTELAASENWGEAAQTIIALEGDAQIFAEANLPTDYPGMSKKAYYAVKGKQLVTVTVTQYGERVDSIEIRTDPLPASVAVNLAYRNGNEYLTVRADATGVVITAHPSMVAQAVELRTKYQTMVRRASSGVALA